MFLLFVVFFIMLIFLNPFYNLTEVFRHILFLLTGRLDFDLVSLFFFFSDDLITCLFFWLSFFIAVIIIVIFFLKIVCLVQAFVEFSFKKLGIFLIDCSDVKEYQAYRQQVAHAGFSSTVTAIGFCGGMLVYYALIGLDVYFGGDIIHPYLHPTDFVPKPNNLDNFTDLNQVDNINNNEVVNQVNQNQVNERLNQILFFNPVTNMIEVQARFDVNVNNNEVVNQVNNINNNEVVNQVNNFDENDIHNFEILNELAYFDVTQELNEFNSNVDNQPVNENEIKVLRNRKKVAQLELMTNVINEMYDLNMDLRFPKLVEEYFTVRRVHADFSDNFSPILFGEKNNEVYTKLCNSFRIVDTKKVCFENKLINISNVYLPQQFQYSFSTQDTTVENQIHNIIRRSPKLRSIASLTDNCMYVDFSKSNYFVNCIKYDWQDIILATNGLDIILDKNINYYNAVHFVNFVLDGKIKYEDYVIYVDDYYANQKIQRWANKHWPRRLSELTGFHLDLIKYIKSLGFSNRYCYKQASEIAENVKNIMIDEQRNRRKK